ncbi:MAG: hypothetical protein Q7S76_01465, partial [bacterium]|nr:hypothetical protein [bacterium]
MTKRSGKTLVRILLLILPFVFLGIFFLWGTTVILPVAHVELRYQYRKVLLDVFHARSIREVVFPEFRFVIIDTR